MTNTFQPLDGRLFPRFAGVRTFYRLPQLVTPEDFDAADVALIGAPYDGGTSFRPGARFGPAHIRHISALGRGHHPGHDVHIFNTLNVGDGGDCPITPQDIDKTHAQIKDTVSTVLSHGCIPLVFGGDHSTTIGTLDAIVQKHGPVGMVHFDAHTDTYPPAWGCDVHHGTFMRLGRERGWFRDGDVVQIGIRGPFSTADDIRVPDRYGFDVWTVDRVRAEGLDAVKERVRAISDGPVFISFDVDGLDPSCAPGTGTPVPGGLTSWEAMQILRETKHLDVVGADIVEVSPPYDNHDITSLVAVTLGFEMMAAMAKRRQIQTPA